MEKKSAKRQVLNGSFLGIIVIFSGCRSLLEPTAVQIDSPSELAPAPQDTPLEPLIEIEVPDTVSTSPVQAPALEVYQIHGFSDNLGNYRVVGLLKNNTDQILDNIQVEITIFDSAGNILQSEVIRTLLYTLTTGETTPFSLWVLNALPEAKDVFGVAISSGPANLERSVIVTRNTNAVIDSHGNLHVTGELFNNTKDPVRINGLAAATFGEDGGLLTADSFSAGGRYLDPGEAGPFRVTMSGAAQGIAEIGDYRVYVDSEAIPPQDYFDLDFSDPQYYFVDGFDAFHLVGEITNNTEKSLIVEILAAVYDQDGRVLDVASANLPLNTLAAGSTLPYDFTAWGPLNTLLGYVDSAARYSVQWDPFWTSPSDSQTADLSTANETYSFEAGYAIFEGTVENNTGSLIRDAVVIVSLMDTKTGQVVATDYETYFAELPDGQTFAFRIEAEIEPDFDLQNVEIVIRAIGKLAK